MVRLKAIKSSEELLCLLSSYINLQSSNLCSFWPHYNDRGVRSNGRLFDGIKLVIIAIAVDCLMEWGWSLLPLLSIWLLSVWSICEAIYFTHKLHARVISVAIKTCYCSHRFDFHRSNPSLRQFTSLMNCMLGSTIYLSPNAVMIARPSSHKSRFICHFRIAILLRGIILQ